MHIVMNSSDCLAYKELNLNRRIMPEWPWYKNRARA